MNFKITFLLAIGRIVYNKFYLKKHTSPGAIKQMTS